MAVLTVSNEVHDSALANLIARGIAAHERLAAMAVLHEIIRWLDRQSFACGKNPTQLAAHLGLELAEIAAPLRLLAEAGAITRMRHRGASTVTITPPDHRPIGRPREYALPP